MNKKNGQKFTKTARAKIINLGRKNPKQTTSKKRLNPCQKPGTTKTKKIDKMNTLENNKLIAEFMGFETFAENTKCYNPKYKDGTISPMKFHSDWNWLMEVVENIESLTDINSNGCFMELESIGFNAKFIFDDGTRILKDSKGETKIEAVYNACVEFIKYYNLQNS